MTERNMKQVIAGWRGIAKHRNDVAREHGRSYSPKAKEYEACADEASVIRDRLVGLVREWRDGVERETKLAQEQWDAGASIGASVSNLRANTLKACADALEQILGPLEGK